VDDALIDFIVALAKDRASAARAINLASFHPQYLSSLPLLAGTEMHGSPDLRSLDAKHIQKTTRWHITQSCALFRTWVPNYCILESRLIDS
jgi:hypothetical protein